MIVRRQGPFNLNQRLNVCRKQIIQRALGARCSATGCSLNIVFFLWILWFFWTLPVLLQCWCLTYLCVQKPTIFNEHPVADSYNVRTNRQSEICRSGFAPKIIGPIVLHRKIPTIFFPFLQQWWGEMAGGAAPGAPAAVLSNYIQLTWCRCEWAFL